MLRHSVLWIMRDPLSAEARTAMLQRLSYLVTEPPSVRSGDYGADLFGGSEVLHRVRPSQRVPIWRRGGEGPPHNFDMALHLDFADWDGFQAYGDDPTHTEASDANEHENWDELTARVDWYYESDAPPTHAGRVKHVAMFVWADGAEDSDKQAALDAVLSLEKAEDVNAVMIGENVSTLTTAYDWIMELEVADRAAAERFLEGAAYAAAMQAVVKATRFEWTARLSHVMHRP
jgi:stress responsive alpha/beta barrel protein